MGVGRPDLLEYISEHIGESVTSSSDKPLIRFFRQHPMQALDLLREYAARDNKRVLSYKIFPEQLTDQQMIELFQRPNLKVIFLTRRRLDVFISYMKAKATNTWMFKPTSHITPELHATDFKEWADKADRWFEFCYGEVRKNGLDWLRFEYDADVNVGKKKLMQTLHKMFNEFGIRTAYAKKAERTEFNRQDTMDCPFDKIENGKEMHQELRDMKLYTYAIASPMNGLKRFESFAHFRCYIKELAGVIGKSWAWRH